MFLGHFHQVLVNRSGRQYDYQNINTDTGMSDTLVSSSFPKIIQRENNQLLYSHKTH